MCSAFGSILGSLCGSLCNKCTNQCACGNICDCSRTTIVVGSTDHDHQVHVQEVLGEDVRDLHTAAHAISDTSIARRRVHVMTQEDVVDQGTGVLMGILEFTRHWASILGGGNGAEAREEGWHRLMSASSFGGVNLQRKYRDSDPLDAKEEKAIVSAIDAIHRYGSAACHLWQVIKMENPDGEGAFRRLRDIGMISRDQLKVFQRALHTAGFLARVLAANRFCDLTAPDQLVFINAAKKFPKTFFQRHANCFWSRVLAAPQGRRLPNLSTDFHTSRIGDVELMTASSTAVDVESLVCRLGDVVHAEKGQERRHLSLGLLRLEVLCLGCGLDFDEVKRERVTEAEFGRLTAKAAKLEARQGGICHLYHALQTTFDPARLKADHGISDRVLSALKTEIRAFPHFKSEIQGTEEICGLPARVIYCLMKVAKKFTSSELAGFNHRYPLVRWMNVTVASPFVVISVAGGLERDSSDEYESKEEVKDIMHQIRKESTEKKTVPVVRESGHDEFETPSDHF